VALQFTQFNEVFHLNYLTHLPIIKGSVRSTPRDAPK